MRVGDVLEVTLPWNQLGSPRQPEGFIFGKCLTSGQTITVPALAVEYWGDMSDTLSTKACRTTSGNLFSIKCESKFNLINFTHDVCIYTFSQYFYVTDNITFDHECLFLNIAKK